MTRDKKFFIDAIKMDLLRVVTVAADLNHKPTKNLVIEFLKHALDDFERIETTSIEENLKKEIIHLMNDFDDFFNDPIKRLRWSEKILTIRCRL